MQSSSDTQGNSTDDSSGGSKSGTGTELRLCDEAYLEKQEQEDFPDLSEQFREFCHEFLENGYNHRKAADSVGRSPDGALSIIRNPLVRKYIRFLQTVRYDDSYVTKDFLDAKLEELQEMAMGEVSIPIVLADGQEVTAKKFQGELAFKILQKRGELSGAAVAPEVSSGNVTVHIDVGALLGIKGEEEKVVSEQ